MPKIHQKFKLFRVTSNFVEMLNTSPLTHTASFRSFGPILNELYYNF